MGWTRISNSGAIALCIGRKDIALRYKLPVNKKFTATHPNGIVVEYGERYTILPTVPMGGKCEGELYRLKGVHVGRERNSSPLLEFKREGFNNLVYGSIDFFSVVPPTTFLGSEEFDPVFISAQRSDEQGNRIGIGTDVPFDISVTVDYSSSGNNLGSTILSWGAGVTDSGSPVYYTEDFWFTHWERVDGTSLEEDRNQCPDEVDFVFTIYDCNDNIVTRRVFPDAPPIVVEEDRQYSEWQYLSWELFHIMGINVQFFTREVEVGLEYFLELSLFAPLVPREYINVPSPLSIVNEATLVEFREIISPPCTNAFPVIEFQCNCNNICPPLTACRIQRGDTICCYDGRGFLIDVVELGCEEPDCIL